MLELADMGAHRIKSFIAYCLFLAVSSAMLFVVLEGVIRFLFPQINFQDTSANLFRENVYGGSVGWEPGAVGYSFGTPIEIDKSGHRKSSFSPVSPQISTLMLGDSVAFGVGVDSDQIFSSLLQRDLPNHRIVNAAVVGYSALNYLDATKHLVLNIQGLERIILIYCLNDTYGYINTKPAPTTILEKTLTRLRSESKLFHAAKYLVADRREFRFKYDASFYKNNCAEFIQAMDAIGSIGALAMKSGIEFHVVIMPYEYQIRNPTPDNFGPQKLLGETFKKRGINHLDIAPRFIESLGSKGAEQFYLFNDPMHLSVAGHALVAKSIAGLFRPQKHLLEKDQGGVR